MKRRLRHCLRTVHPSRRMAAHMSQRLVEALAGSPPRVAELVQRHQQAHAARVPQQAFACGPVRLDAAGNMADTNRACKHRPHRALHIMQLVCLRYNVDHAPQRLATLTRYRNRDSLWG